MSDQYNSRIERRKKQKKRAPKNTAPTPAAKKPKKKKSSLAKKIFLTFAALFLLCLAGGVGTFAMMVKDAPKLDEGLLRDPISSKIYDMNGDFVTSVGSEKRDYVKYEDVPQLVRDAILATEDARFFKHHGVDIIRIGGAAIKNVTNGFGSEGASTITQQVVKMSFLSPDKTLKRKAQEAWLAYQLDKEYSKEEIFEMYVNKVYMSDRIFGIKEAANHYFGKDLDELTLPEAALIAGMPQSPNNYNPFDHPDRAEKRRNVVLSLMEQHHKISNTEMAKAKQASLSSQLAEKKPDTGNAKKFNSYIDLVIEEVEKMGEYNPYSDGLKIYTTLDPKAQTYMEKLLDTEDIINYPSEQFQAGISLIDTQTGEVRAIGGGRNQKVERGFNYAVDLKQRQPGSVIKPLIDYGPAIEYLKWSTYQQLDDRPDTYSNGTPIRNAGGSYMGPLSMRTALVYSRNIPALQTYKKVGHEKANEFLNNVGIQIPKQQSENESNSIGAMSGISPLDLSGAYAAFGNGGTYNKPHTVKKIVLPDGDTEVRNDVKPKEAMSDYTAYMITDMLKDVVDEGTGRLANIPGLPLAGKTGTTNYTAKEKREWNIPSSGSPDSWFVGYTTNYTAAIWTGYESKKEYLSKDSQKISKELFKHLMEEVSSDEETKNFKKPNSVVELPIKKGSNPAEIAGAGTPGSEKVYELFVKGEEPKKVFNDFKEKDKEKDKDKEKEEETEGKIENLTASYNASSQSISVSWSFGGKGSPSFTVSSSTGESQSTGGSSAVFGNAQPGNSYSFTVTATVDGKTVDTASTSITVPSGEEPPVDEDQDNPTQPDDNNPDNPDSDDNNNGGDNGNGDSGGGNNGGGNNGGGNNGGGNNGGGNNGGGNNGGGNNGGGNNGGGNNGGGNNGGGNNGGGSNGGGNNGGGNSGTPTPPTTETPGSGGGTPTPPSGNGNTQQDTPATPPPSGNQKQGTDE
ncbi:PBP1A family penicillin-binding protein [Bacillus sp. PK3_68]|uniref:transglycosylase domain-containing protein n=1 Tax=Bacillus sp. PK3_68 TaxID=2027408 RepID=UPI000E727EC9|nr:PBP1A family penicillin-binding protein [Bacillus sp. PK3_68]RJS59508.1 penicillin-binding protein [Bacillus sp. PK3_68]